MDRLLIQKHLKNWNNYKYYKGKGSTYTYSLSRDTVLARAPRLICKPYPQPLNHLNSPQSFTATRTFAAWYMSKMAFRSRISPIFRSSLSAVRTAVARRTLTSQSKEGASSFRFAGPLLIGASAATAGLFAATQLYNNNFSLFGYVHAATKVGILDWYLIYSQG